MSLRKIIKGYGSIFFGFLTFLAIAGMCVLAGFAVAFPLWKLASVNVGLYTIISISLFSCALIYLMVKKIIKAYKKSPRRLIISFLRKLTIIGGLLISFRLVLTFHKMSALIVLILVFFIYGFLAFDLNQTKNKSNEGL